jgi:protein-disulfide isomerase
MEELKPKVGGQSKIYFILGLLGGIAVISTLGFFALLSVLYGSNFSGKTLANSAVGAVQAENNVNTDANVNTQPQVPSEPQADATKLSPVTKDDHVRGDFNAPVTLILFSDFQCPYCASLNNSLDQVLANYKGKVRLVFRHFPLSFHDQAEKAAEAAECAGEQGKFWEMHDKIFAANEAGTMSVDQWKKDAKTLGLKTSQFNDCLDSGKYADKISRQQAEGENAGVQGTPATFINSELVSGALPYDSIKQIIDSKLSQ